MKRGWSAPRITRTRELAHAMRWVLLIIGGIATAAMLGISMRLNFLFGYSLGQTPEKAQVFGWVSVISDACGDGE